METEASEQAHTSGAVHTIARTPFFANSAGGARTRNARAFLGACREV